MYHLFDINETRASVWLSRNSERYYLEILDGSSGDVALIETGPGHGRVQAAGESDDVVYLIDVDVIHVHLRGQAYAVRYIDPLAAFGASGEDTGQNIARAPMPGVVVSVKISPGDTVLGGEVLMVVESMKLETQIRATKDGTVERVHFNPGDSFDRDAVLVTLSQENG